MLRKESLLCVGLDTMMESLPEHLRSQPDAMYIFNKAIIEATKDFAVAYKVNTAFYEAEGVKGWVALEKTLAALPDNVLKIADAKRGDIGTSSTQYARAFFEALPFDAITVAPYMGSDSFMPFLNYPNKWTFLLAVTSNSGASDFQFVESAEGQPLYRKVMATAQRWDAKGYLGFVVGATRPELLRQVRAAAPDKVLLVPGVGAQGGSLHQVMENGVAPGAPVLINSSRSIIYASSGRDFDTAACHAAAKLRDEMRAHSSLKLLA